MEDNLAIKPLSRRIYAIGLILCVAALSGCSLLGGPVSMPTVSKADQIQKVKAMEQTTQNNPNMPAALKAQELGMFQRRLNELQGPSMPGDPSKK
jgi:predicted small lipoprotein YifL